MSPLLVALSLVGLLGIVPFCGGAPAVTSVHVSFVSGNKKTQYSHGTHTRPAVVQYNLESAGTGDDLLLRRLRSISSASPEQQAGPGNTKSATRRLRFRRPTGGILLVSPQTTTATTSNSGGTWTSTLKLNTDKYHVTPTTSTTSTTTATKRKYRGSPSPLTFAPVPTLTTSKMTKAVTTPATNLTSRLRRFRSRVRFVESPAAAPTSAATSSTSVPPTPTDSQTANSMTKPKDTKAVKRSPYIENFESRGITFPDFDEFGGNEFGALRNFIGGSGADGGGGGAPVAHSHANPESLSPDGVFLPPLPAEANDYTEDGHGHGHGGGDPYVADPETAKYAAQHPPFFAAFPHKRTVLDLNERRVEQGLEPNILRSIRPYFAFFEAAKPRHYSHDSVLTHVTHHHHPSAPEAVHLHADLDPGLVHTTSISSTSGLSPGVSGSAPGNLLGVLGGHSDLPSSYRVFSSSSVAGEDHTQDPNLLQYTHALLNSPASEDVAEAWSLFPHKRRRK